MDSVSLRTPWRYLAIQPRLAAVGPLGLYSAPSGAARPAAPSTTASLAPGAPSTTASPAPGSPTPASPAAPPARPTGPTVLASGLVAPWGIAFLPGGDLSASIGPAQKPDLDFARFVKAASLAHPQVALPLVQRLARAYGSRALPLLRESFGAEVAPGLFEAELNFLRREEWACSADDVLWRRSKLGLHYTPAQRAAVADWCAHHWADAAAPGQPAAIHQETAWN